MSQLAICLETAHNFLLSREEAQEIFTHQIQIITENWDTVCAEAELGEVDQRLLWNRQFLNSYSMTQ